MTASLDLTLELAVLLATGVVLLSVVVSPLATRLGAPILLLFLGIGMLAGQDGPGGYVFNDFDLVYDLGSIALAVILFAGGLGTRAADIRVCIGPALSMATLGVMVTAGVVGLAGWLAGMPLFVALLLGAVVGSTDAAATFLLLQGRGIRLRGRVMETIVVESGLNDPMAIFLTLTLVTIVDAGGGVDSLSWALAGSFAQQIGIGALAGVAGGLGLGLLVNRLRLAAGLYGVLALAAALALFEATQLAGGSGYLAVYLCGVLTMQRVTDAHRQELDITHGSLAWLSQILMFLLLGLLVTPSDLGAEALHAAGVAAVLIFIARPVAVAVCLAPFRYRLRERLFIAWVGLRGAVPIFLAIIPVLSPGPIDTDFFNVVFLVVIASLVLQGWTIPWLARRLDLETPPTAGEPADADPLRP
jgi:NhaP-type Na+/H+ and K+/H+ antiporter